MPIAGEEIRRNLAEFAAHDPDESNRRLLELNRRIGSGEIDYSHFE